METLNSKILQEARESVAAKYGYDDWKEVEKKATSGQENGMLSESTELAMGQQAEFFRWASRDHFYEPRTDCWFSNKDLLKSYRETELFEIWKEGKGG